MRPDGVDMREKELEREKYLHSDLTDDEEPLSAYAALPGQPSSVSRITHYDVRKMAAIQLATIGRRVGITSTTFIPRLSSTYISCLTDPSRSLSSHFGALFGLIALGPHAFHQLLLPHLASYLAFLRPSLHSDDAETRLDAECIAGAIIEALKRLMNHPMFEAVSEEEAEAEGLKSAKVEKEGESEDGKMEIDYIRAESDEDDKLSGKMDAEEGESGASGHMDEASSAESGKPVKDEAIDELSLTMLDVDAALNELGISSESEVAALLREAQKEASEKQKLKEEAQNLKMKAGKEKETKEKRKSNEEKDESVANPKYGKIKFVFPTQALKDVLGERIDGLLNENDNYVGKMKNSGW